MDKKAEKLFKDGNKEAAIKEIVNDLNRDHHQLDKILQLSAYLVEAGDLEQAEELLTKSLTLFSENKDVRYNLGNIYFLANKYDKANELFSKLIQDNYGFEAYFMEAKTLDEQGKKQMAIVYALTAVEKNPKDIASIELMADLLLANGNFSEAKKYYQSAILLKPKAKYYFNSALCAMNLKQDYQSYLEQSKKIDPKFFAENEKKLANLQKYLTETGDSNGRR
ncbi:tetratricopeptide repeat protein [Companilactobacillus keshanensis]|uniref:Tetratricopeptide repeat protein n=1 Tax=Companilactobacillus keshanensis TaxID=2486003 RepID=A0ABW4BVD9_9LACO|nr:tetratricopeptide repeat protein [Companilactobacillus keshanensis]